MAKIQDIVNSEKTTPENMIRLVRVNNGFLRAYNKSAWKFHQFINQYKVKRQFVKSINEETFSLGFLEAKLHIVAEGRRLEGTETGYDLMLTAEEKPGEEAEYEQWCAAIPISNASTSDYDALPLAGEDAVKEVLRRLRIFPVDRRTPVECQSFLSQLKGLLDGES